MLIDWLNNYGGKLGKYLALAFAFVDAKVTYGATISIVISYLISHIALTWTVLSELSILNKILIVISVFTYILWTYVGICLLKRLRAPTQTFLEPEYQYFIGVENAHIGISEDGNDQRCTVRIILKNHSAYPCRVRVEKFEVRIDDRIVSVDTKDPKECLIYSQSTRGVTPSLFSKDLINTKTNRNVPLEGRLEAIFSYGPPEGQFKRTYTSRANVTIMISVLNRKIVGPSSSITLGDPEDTETPWSPTNSIKQQIGQKIPTH